MEIDVFIDQITPCLFDKESGRLIKTKYRSMSFAEIIKLTKGWKFKWKTEFAEEYEVYALTLEFGEIQGLISLKQSEGFIDVNLVESSPQNVGSNGRFEGVGAHLFAIACKLSFEVGFEGYVSFTAKTNLIDHYKKTLQAKQIGNTQNMFIDTEAAWQLIKTYFNQEVSS